MPRSVSAAPARQPAPRVSAAAAYDTQLLAVGVVLASGLPLLLRGGPGEGKTSAVSALAGGLGWHVEVVLASLREPSDFAGLPIPDTTSGRVRLAPPDWAYRIVEDPRRSLLFFDEVSCAPPAVQAALLRVCAERVVGDLRLPADTVVVAAANPPSVAADGWDLAPPLANRFVHLDWQLSGRVVADGLLAGFTTPALPVLPVDVGPARHAARSQVAAYLRAKPGDVACLPEDLTAAGRAFPTPRTWDYAARLLAVCLAARVDRRVQHLVLAGTIGEGAALQLQNFLDHLDLPDAEQVLADPSALVLPARGDRAYAVLASVVAAVLADPTPARWTAGVIAVSQAAVAGRPDVGSAAVLALLRHRPPGAELPDELTRFAGVLRAAGLAA